MEPARATDTAAASRTHAIGIDVGGTKIAGGLVDLATGAVSGRRQLPAGYHRGGEAVLADVASLARDLLAEARAAGTDPVALGIGAPELVSRQGQVFSSHRITWQGIDVQDRLQPILPTTVSSDVRAAALAEARYGAGRDFEHFYFVTIGTGVSGVLVQHGQPYFGARGAALVIASGTTFGHCPACGHGSHKVVEDIASGPGIAEAYGRGLTAESVLAAARTGDPAALAVIGNATRELGNVLAVLAGGLDPEAIIVGGGLGSAPGPYFAELERATRASLWTGDVHDLPMLQAQFGPDAGLIGAAAATIKQAEPVDRHLPEPAT